MPSHINDHTFEGHIAKSLVDLHARLDAHDEQLKALLNAVKTPEPDPTPAAPAAVK